MSTGSKAVRSLALAAVLLTACDGTKVAGDGGQDAGCNYPRVQAVSQPCCEKWGLDACGALLFCAKFDGREVATCYPNRSRMVNESCQDDSHCVSNVCHNLDGGSDDRCLQPNSLTAYELCRNDDYCASRDCGVKDQMCLGTSETSCLRHESCSTKEEKLACTIIGSTFSPFSCRKVVYGQVCRTADDCDSKRCVRGACEPARAKFTGEACEVDGDCISDHCYQKVCQCLKSNGRGCADGTTCTGTTHTLFGDTCEKK